MNDDCKDHYLTTEETRNLLGVSTQTLRLWDQKGKIRSIRTPSNRRRYSQKDIYDILGWTQPTQKKEKVIYTRVSSKKQVDDLRRQEDFLKSKFPHHLLVTDIGSGLNWKRKGLKTILERASRGGIEEVVVAHRDRLCRFAFELFEFLFEMYGVKLIVLDTEEGKSTEQELAEDILSIVHIYSCRNMGRRRYSSKKNSSLSNSQSEEDPKAVDGNNESGL